MGVDGMKDLLRITKVIMVFAFVAGVTSCTTYVSKVNKLDGYNKKMNEVRVSWINPANLKISLRKSGQGVGVITQEDKEASKNGIKTLLSLFGEHGVNMVSKALGNNSVATVSNSGSPLYKFAFT